MIVWSFKQFPTKMQSWPNEIFKFDVDTQQNLNHYYLGHPFRKKKMPEPNFRSKEFIWHSERRVMPQNITEWIILLVMKMNNDICGGILF